VTDYARFEKRKGVVWEYRVHRAIFASGWYVRRNIDLRERIAGAPQVMAEIDLLGASFDAGLTMRHRIAECKNRRGSGQEADRVIWLLGLGQLMEVDDLMLAKPRISAATVRFAKSTNVALFEEANAIQVEGLLQNPRTAGTFDADINEDIIAPAVSRPLLADNRLRDAYDWIHNASWTEPAVPRVRRLPGYFRLVMENAKDETRQVLLIEGLLGLLACGLQFAGTLRRHSPSVARALAAEALASGAAPASALKDIAASADEYYRNAIARAAEEQTGKRLMITAERLAEHIANPPRWSDSFFAMADSLGSRPELATDVLRYAELTLYERLAGRDPVPAQVAFVRTDHGWLASSLALAAGFCERIWGLEDPFFAQFALPEGAAVDDVGEIGAVTVSESPPMQTETDNAAPPAAQESLLDEAGKALLPGPSAQRRRSGRSSRP
jgi:hypothetical protein